MSRRLPAAGLLLLLLVPAAAAQDAGVTRADAEAWMREVERAYAREDLGKLLELSDNEALKLTIRSRVGRLFKDRNYLKLKMRLLEFQTRPDGSAELELLDTLRSRPLRGTSDLREKSRRRVRVAKRDGRVVVIDTLAANEPKLADSGDWSTLAWTGRVEIAPRPLKPFGSPEGDVRVQLTGRFRNGGTQPLQDFEFGLHPFVTEIDLRTETDESLTLTRHEGIADAWRTRLPAPVEPGEVVELGFSYAFDEVGRGANASIGPEAAILFAESAWYPLLSPTPIAGADRFDHDLSIVVPESWTAVSPGTQLGDRRIAAGRRELRWRSDFPGEGLSIVAGPLERAEIRLTDRLTAEVFTQPGAGGFPPELGERIAHAAGHFEELLGPAPHSRIAIVQQPAGGLRYQPGYIVIDDLQLADDELYYPRRERQPLFFVVHQLTHLWLQEGVHPVGGPAQILTEALCDTLTFDWFDAQVEPAVSLWHRSRILHLARGRPGADRPIMVTHPGSPDHDVFGAGKALIVMECYKDFAGRERWAENLRSYVQGRRGGQVGAGALLDALGGGDPRLESFVQSWIVGEGFADIVVHEPVVRELVDETSGETVYETELLVENKGQGPVPVRLRVAEDYYGAPWQEERLELGALESSLLRYRLPHPLRLVEADPGLRTWQSEIFNDNFPRRKEKPKSFKGQRRVVTPEQQERLEELLSGKK